jgi:aspartate oxidase
VAIETDVLIIGCGIAGAAAALRLAENRQRQITILTRTHNAAESNTRYAQGGIVARPTPCAPAQLCACPRRSTC